MQYAWRTHSSMRDVHTCCAMQYAWRAHLLCIMCDVLRLGTISTVFFSLIPQAFAFSAMLCIIMCGCWCSHTHTHTYTHTHTHTHAHTHTHTHTHTLTHRLWRQQQPVRLWEQGQGNRGIQKWTETWQVRMQIFWEVCVCFIFFSWNFESVSLLCFAIVIKAEGLEGFVAKESTIKEQGGVLILEMVQCVCMHLTSL